MRLTGAIPKQSNSTVQIRPPLWLNLLRKPELDLLPLELDFLFGRGLQMASEAKSDLTNDFVMAKYPFLALFGILLRLIGLL